MKEIQSICQCHVGCVRSENQDNYLFNNQNKPSNLQTITIHSTVSLHDKTLSFGVFDGMGGLEQGTLASFAASEWFLKHTHNVDWFDTHQVLHAYQQCNDFVHAKLQKTRSEGGSTCALFHIKNNMFSYSNVGDSRLYYINDQHCNLYTEDHTEANFLYQANIIDQQQYKSSPKKHVLMQYLGLSKREGLLQPFVQCNLPLNKGIYLLATDGMHQYFSENQLISLCQINDIKLMDQQIYNELILNKANDNFTYIIIHVKE